MTANRIIEIKTFLAKYISLNYLINSKGGRETIKDNEELGDIYESAYDTEIDILRAFGLPPNFKYRDILIPVLDENIIDQTITNLSDAAMDFLNSSPINEIDLLEEAKKEDLRTYEIHPDLGIDDSLYSIFIYEKKFKKCKINARDTINILRSIKSKTGTQLGYLHYSINHEETPQDEIKEIEEELSCQNIPYLKEFINFKIKYPY